MSEIEPALGVLELVVEQLAPASPTEVFDAWTDDGMTLTIAGEFLDIQPNESLTYTWGIDPDSEPNEYVYVSFAPHDDGTLVTVRHEKIPTTDLLDGHRAGWASCLSGLLDFPFES